MELIKITKKENENKKRSEQSEQPKERTK